MPEGDVVRRTAVRLDRALSGRPLVGAELRWPSLGGRSLHGMTTLEVVSRGKHLLHRLDSGLTLHSHLRMEGRWRIRPTSEVSAKSVAASSIRAILATDTWAAIGHDLGMLDLVSTRDEDRLVGHLGPDLLGDDWDEDEAVRRLSGTPDRAIGAALLDQRNLAGLGTIFTAEPLFATRTNPWTPVGDLDSDRLRAVLRTAQGMLQRSLDAGPGSLTERVSTTDDSWVHARSGRPCLRCGGTVRVSPVGDAPQQRPMFYCPTCQGGLAPGDDGHTQAPLGSR